MSSALLFNPSEIRALSAEFESASPTDILRWAFEQFGARAAIGTSFQGAGLVTIHHAVTAGIPFPVFTIDTGLLFPETLELKRRLEEFLGIEIESLVPELTVEAQGREIAPELWKRNPDLCCTIRKVEPLQKKLGEIDAWITGLRRDQSKTRARTQVLELYEFDRLRGKNILKVNPLTNWSREEVWNYIRAQGIPYNPLADRGYRSIGCHPCTSAVFGEQNDRAGRWTGFDKNECGIHTFLGENI
jgi:phosphoadenosine phosphosulfate reductase